MKEEWKKVKLGEISADIQTGPFGSQLHMSDYSEKGIPVVMPKDMINGKITEENIARVTDNHVKRLNRYIISSGNILYARRGDVGKCVYVSEKESGWLCGTGCLRININTAIANPKFVFFQLQKTETIGWVEKNAVGATMLNLNTSILANVPLHLPPLPTQQKIASVLSAYDDLIENNRRQIKLLEEAALKLYKEWFVKLNFPGHETTKIADGVPDGWKKVKAGDYFVITIGKTPPRKESKWFSACKGKKWISIADMGNSGTYILNTSEYLTEEAVKSHNVKVIPANTVLLSFKLTVGRVSITSEEMTTNEAIAHFVTDKDFVIEYLYLNLKNYNYNSLGSTSAISTAINSKIVKSMPIIIPDEKILKMFSNLMKPYFNKIKNCQLSIVNCQSARDKLLPKLMNGEIEV